jgi:hypothetical protein
VNEPSVDLYVGGIDTGLGQPPMQNYLWPGFYNRVRLAQHVDHSRLLINFDRPNRFSPGYTESPSVEFSKIHHLEY